VQPADVTMFALALGWLSPRLQIHATLLARADEVIE
jgi:hypothetical protein